LEEDPCEYSSISANVFNNTRARDIKFDSLTTAREIHTHHHTNNININIKNNEISTYSKNYNDIIISSKSEEEMNKIISALSNLSADKFESLKTDLLSKYLDEELEILHKNANLKENCRLLIQTTGLVIDLNNETVDYSISIEKMNLDKLLHDLAINLIKYRLQIEFITEKLKPIWNDDIKKIWDQIISIMSKLEEKTKLIENTDSIDYLKSSLQNEKNFNTENNLFIEFYATLMSYNKVNKIFNIKNCFLEKSKYNLRTKRSISSFSIKRTEDVKKIRKKINQLSSKSHKVINLYGPPGVGKRDVANQCALFESSEFPSKNTLILYSEDHLKVSISRSLNTQIKVVIKNIEYHIDIFFNALNKAFSEYSYHNAHKKYTLILDDVRDDDLLEKVLNRAFEIKFDFIIIVISVQVMQNRSINDKYFLTEISPTDTVLCQEAKLAFIANIFPEEREQHPDADTAREFVEEIDYNYSSLRTAIEIIKMKDLNSEERDIKFLLKILKENKQKYGSMETKAMDRKLANSNENHHRLPKDRAFSALVESSVINAEHKDIIYLVAMIDYDIVPHQFIKTYTQQLNYESFPVVQYNYNDPIIQNYLQSTTFLEGKNESLISNNYCDYNIHMTNMMKQASLRAIKNIYDENSKITIQDYLFCYFDENEFKTHSQKSISLYVNKNQCFVIVNHGEGEDSKRFRIDQNKVKFLKKMNNTDVTTEIDVQDRIQIVDFLKRITLNYIDALCYTFIFCITNETVKHNAKFVLLSHLKRFIFNVYEMDLHEKVLYFDVLVVVYINRCLKTHDLNKLKEQILKKQFSEYINSTLNFKLGNYEKCIFFHCPIDYNPENYNIKYLVIADYLDKKALLNRVSGNNSLPPISEVKLVKKLTNLHINQLNFTLVNEALHYWYHSEFEEARNLLLRLSKEQYENEYIYLDLELSHTILMNYTFIENSELSYKNANTLNELLRECTGFTPFEIPIYYNSIGLAKILFKKNDEARLAIKKGFQELKTVNEEYGDGSHLRYEVELNMSLMIIHLSEEKLSEEDIIKCSKTILEKALLLIEKFISKGKNYTDTKNKLVRLNEKFDDYSFKNKVLNTLEIIFIFVENIYTSKHPYFKIYKRFYNEFKYEIDIVNFMEYKFHIRNNKIFIDSFSISHENILKYINKFFFQNRLALKFENNNYFLSTDDLGIISVKNSFSIKNQCDFYYFTLKDEIIEESCDLNTSWNFVLLDDKKPIIVDLEQKVREAINSRNENVYLSSDNAKMFIQNFEKICEDNIISNTDKECEIRKLLQIFFDISNDESTLRKNLKDKLPQEFDRYKDEKANSLESEINKAISNYNIVKNRSTVKITNYLMSNLVGFDYTNNTSLISGNFVDSFQNIQNTPSLDLHQREELYRELMIQFMNESKNDSSLYKELLKIPIEKYNPKNNENPEQFAEESITLEKKHNESIFIEPIDDYQKIFQSNDYLFVVSYSKNSKITIELNKSTSSLEKIKDDMNKLIESVKKCIPEKNSLDISHVDLYKIAIISNEQNLEIIINFLKSLNTNYNVWIKRPSDTKNSINISANNDPTLLTSEKNTESFTCHIQ
jgi:hypothetical protein